MWELIHASFMLFMFWLYRKIHFFSRVNTNPYFCSSREDQIWKNSENSNVEKTQRHSLCIFQSIVTRRVISKQIWNIKGLCRFEKSIHFREKYTMKRPQMKGWTVCGILKKLYTSIQLYGEMKFIRKSESCITLREKILRLRKKWNMIKIIFQKLSAQDLEVRGFAVFHKNDAILGNVV